MNKAIYIESLNLEKSGNWDASHRLIQQYYTPEACWIHAYLHRVEGDLGNAGYWYSRAGKVLPSVSLDKEWDDLMNYMENL